MSVGLSLRDHMGARQVESTDDRQTLKFIRFNERQIDVGFGNLLTTTNEPVSFTRLSGMFSTMEFIISCFK